MRGPDGEAALVATNDYRLLSPGASERAPGLQESACSRFDRAKELSARLSREPSDQDLLSILTDEQVQLSITAQHVVLRPAEGRMSVFSPARFHL